MHLWRYTNAVLFCAGLICLTGCGSGVASSAKAEGQGNGACGTANGQLFGSAPGGSALCSVGTASSVSGSGPWQWTCAGTNGGSTASCTASLASGGNTVTPNLVASRTSGYAPLAVHFDATGATSVIASINDSANGGTFRQIKHAFDFGDPTSGTHSIDGRSRNFEPLGGGLAAHVFDTPGTYTVTVTSSDGVGVSATASVVITVNDPSSLTTYAISQTGDFTDAPAGSTHLTQSSLPSFASNSRYFFHRGEVWASPLEIDDPLTNVQVDAYGTGANPVFDSVNIGDRCPASANFATDIRISNITSKTGFTQSVGGRVLFYKSVSLSPMSTSGAGWYHYDTNCALPKAQFVNSYEVFYVDCQMIGDGTSTDYEYIGNGSRLVFMNTQMGGVAQGTIRIGGWDRGVMRHCRIEDPYSDSSVHALKVHAGGPNAYTDNWVASGGINDATSNFVDWKTSKVVIANNTFGGGNNGGAAAIWTTTFCPQNDGYGALGLEPVEDVIIEGNTFIHQNWSGINADIAWGGKRMTSRNNSVQGSGSLGTGTGHTQPPALDGPYFLE